MATDLEKAYGALKNKNRRQTLLWDYYHGNHPLIYSSERLNEVFRSIDARFTENWCSVIVDSSMDRLDLVRFEVAGNEAAQARLNELWLQAGMGLDSDDAHEAALVCGEAFVIGWPASALPGQVPELYYNDPRMVHVEYDPERPRVKRWAAKWWKTEAVTDTAAQNDASRSGSVYRMTLYYPDRLEYYTAASSGGALPSSASAFKPWPATDPPDPAQPHIALNPLGVVPVFHLRTRGNSTAGELTTGVIDLQNAVNKLVADMMISAEFAAFRQRYVISNADIGALKNAPNEIWDLPAGDGVSQDTQAGEFSATQLSNYFSAIDKLALALGVISRTPKHYFFAQSGDPSGEALLAMESPLNKKVSRYIERFTVAWREVAWFLLTLAGFAVDKWAITPIFALPETTQPLTRAQGRNFDVNSGIPLVTVLRREGWSDAELAQMAADRRKAEAAQQSSLAQALLEQQRQFDREENPPQSPLQEGDE